MIKYFTFDEALSCLNCDMKVGIIINNKERHYYMNNGQIYCTVGENICYLVKQFYTDAILSNKWFLVE